MPHITYTTHGTCAKKIEIEIDENDIIKDIKFFGGCSGNTQGIASLVKGMKAEDVVERLEGIKCGFKETSCPDQLSKALKNHINSK